MTRLVHRFAKDRSIAQGALVGALAGVFASYVMERVQDAAAHIGLQPPEGGDPATVKLAERLAGHAISRDGKPGAGALVHYVFGCALGTIYGVATEIEPRAGFAFGLPFGATVALVADEVGVPLLGLSEPPWATPAYAHGYSFGSHLVFGAVLEGARQVMMRLLRS